MTHSVYKYEIPIQDNFTLDMPAGAQVLHVDVQTQKVISEGAHLPVARETPYLWALVNTDDPVMKAYNFRLVGTGHAVENRNNLEHVGTFLLQGGGLVFHLFGVCS